MEQGISHIHRIRSSVVGIGLGSLLHKSTTPLISDSFFNALLVMISIFIGYVSVIVVFYLGKMDEHEREFLHVLNNVRIYEEELFTSIHRLYPKLGSKPHQTRIEAFRTAMEQMRSDPIYTEENRNGLIEESKEFAFSLFVGVFFR